MEDNDLKTLLPVAIKLAVDYHGSTIGRDGRPYIEHPLRLMSRAESYAEKIVAVLHDAIEDTNLTLSDLSRSGFPREIVDTIDALTHREGDSYNSYIERLSLNPLAAKVKLLDLYDNIDVTRLPSLDDRDLERVVKYHAAINRLKK